MTKKNFVYLALTTCAGLMFALGMCMCLLPEWNAFVPGVVVTALGIIALCAIGLVRWVQAGKPIAEIDWNEAGKIAYCVACALVLGAGMAMIMAFEGLMLYGILVGIVGIVMGLGIIPLFKGLK